MRNDSSRFRVSTIPLLREPGSSFRCSPLDRANVSGARASSLETRSPLGDGARITRRGGKMVGREKKKRKKKGTLESFGARGISRNSKMNGTSILGAGRGVRGGKSPPPVPGLHCKMIQRRRTKRKNGTEIQECRNGRRG